MGEEVLPVGAVEDDYGQPVVLVLVGNSSTNVLMVKPA